MTTLSTVDQIYVKYKTVSGDTHAYGPFVRSRPRSQVGKGRPRKLTEEKKPYYNHYSSVASMCEIANVYDLLVSKFNVPSDKKTTLQKRYAIVKWINNSSMELVKQLPVTFGSN